MPGLDWDRETREARKRRHGSVPVWADPSVLSTSDEREVQRLLGSMNELLGEYLALSQTQRDQRRSEFTYRLSTLEKQAVSEATAFRQRIRA
jgi:hypothetical protein